MELTGGNARVISGAPQYHSSPIVCDSGRTVVFISNSGGGNHIWKSDADGTNAVQVTHGVGEVYPQCPREGRWLAFVSEDEAIADGNLRKISLDGGKDSPMVSTPVIAINLAPDGKHILFATVDYHANNQIRVGQATLDGSASINYLDPTPRPSVLRDGRWIPGSRLWLTWTRVPALRMSGVTRWWGNNSRNSLRIFFPGTFSASRCRPMEAS